MYLWVLSAVKIIDSAIIGVLCYIITSILGTPYAVLVSVIVGVTNVIPIFWTIFGSYSKCIYYLAGKSDAVFIFPDCNFIVAAVLMENILGPKDF